VGEILMSAEEIMAELKLTGREGTTKPESHEARFREWRKRNDFPDPAVEGGGGTLLWLRQDFAEWCRKNKPLLKQKRKEQAKRGPKGAVGTSHTQLYEALKAEGELDGEPEEQPDDKPRPKRVRLDD
jgi:hypothetical protein